MSDGKTIVHVHNGTLALVFKKSELEATAESPEYIDFCFQCNISDLKAILKQSPGQYEVAYFKDGKLQT